ncbi:MAG: NAD(P)-dependent glycerol-3-phosphate dehydrogenase [Proteobacteria bacterium]|nr:NAD(P)-dependent glycerol-3-phosphate dehydrogenase [Pseudomonadota bacterium]
MGTPVAVIGGGSFGTCLAMLCAREHDVRLWARDAAVVEGINRDRRNPRYLTQAEIPSAVQATSDLAEALSGAELVILSVPSHSIREVMLRALPAVSEEAILVSTIKGIEFETGMTMHQVLRDVLPEPHHPRIACLSGPSFAKEIAQQKNTVVTVACEEPAYAISVQSTLSCPWFRCYSHDDVVGVELGGALKNVVAIAVGMADGMEAGDNTRAALMTRGLAEITRLGVQMGANPLTFLGLSGMGDLVLTCAGDLSRNRRVGLELGRGRKLDDILADMGEVAEGVRTTRAICRLAERLEVEMPIAEMVRSVLDAELTPAQAGLKLMTRPLGAEHEY